MKVVQVNCVYDFGSTGRIVKSLHEGLLQSGHESLVLYGRGAPSSDPRIIKTSSELGAKVHSALARLFGGEFAFSRFATNKALRILKREKPDLVHLHCLNGNFINVYRLISYLKKNNIKTVLTLHAEIMHTAGCEHAVECEKWKTECHSCPKIKGKISRYFRDDARHAYRRMKKAVAGFDELTVVGVSRWLTERAAQSPIFAEAKFSVVHNGTDTGVFRPTVSDLRERLGITESEKVVLHVTPDFRHSTIKGSHYVTALTEKMSDYRFLIVGAGTEDIDFPKNVLAVGRTESPKELAEYYSAADVTLLTSIRETYSMVCAESLCCGTPVAGFFAGGPESICLAEHSLFCEQGDTPTLEKNVRILASREKTDFFSLAEKNYSAEQMNQGYFELYGIGR